MEESCINCKFRHGCATFDFVVIEAFHSDLSYPLLSKCNMYAPEYGVISDNFEEKTEKPSY